MSGLQESLSALFETGRIVDLILGMVAIEAVALGAYRRSSGHGAPAAELLSNLLAGACLLLALRSALLDAGWAWIAACLSGSLLAHLAWLALRLRANSPAGS